MKRKISILLILLLLLTSCYGNLPTNEELSEITGSLKEGINNDNLPVLTIGVPNMSGMEDLLVEGDINSYLEGLNRGYRVKFNYYGGEVKNFYEFDSLKYFNDIKENLDSDNMDIIVVGGGKPEDIYGGRLRLTKLLRDKDLLEKLPEDFLNYPNILKDNSDGNVYFLGYELIQEPIYFLADKKLDNFSLNVDDNYGEFKNMVDSLKENSLYISPSYKNLKRLHFEMGSKLLSVDLKNHKVDLFYRQDDYMRLLEEFLNLREKSIIRDDIDGASYLILNNIGDFPGENTMYEMGNRKFYPYPIFIPYKHNSWYISGQMGLYKNSGNKEYALDFFKLLQDDIKLNNIIRYGNVKGEGANKNINEAFLLDPHMDASGENLILLKEKYGLERDISGFYFDIEPIRKYWDRLISFENGKEVSDLISLIDRMDSNSMDAIEKLDNLIGDLDMEKIIIEYERQLNDFLDSK